MISLRYSKHFGTGQRESGVVRISLQGSLAIQLLIVAFCHSLVPSGKLSVGRRPSASESPASHLTARWVPLLGTALWRGTCDPGIVGVTVAFLVSFSIAAKRRIFPRLF